MEIEKAKDLYNKIGQKRIEENLPSKFNVIEVFKDAPEYEILLGELNRAGIDYVLDEDEVYTKSELLQSPILRIVPNGHKGGYPQPEGGGKEENYQSFSFDLNTGCPYCTNGRLQNKPLRLKSSVNFGRNFDISGIWWLRELIVSKKLKELIESSNLTGCEFWPVIKHGKNVPFDDIFQLKITGELPAMSERAEIIHKPFTKDYLNVCPYGCGSKFIEGSVCYRGEDLDGVSDFALTKEWFGVNDEFWRWPFMSQKSYRLFVENKIKGVRFYPPVIE